jgi:hypothetical protein
MKFFAVILSLYVLVLTAMPCIDIPNERNLQKTELSKDLQDNHQHNDADGCSPFCTCNCCATSFIFEGYQPQYNCFASPEKQYSYSPCEEFTSPLANIWQPPKIA